MYFDSHAHLDDSRVVREYPDGTEGIIRDSLAAGVRNIINVGTNLQNSVRSISLANKYPFIYAAVGIYPSEARSRDDGKALACGMDADLAIGEIELLLEEKKVVAIGEIGLDYHYDNTDKKAQLYVFEKQMDLAQRTGFPVVIHDREAHGDVFDMIRRYPDVKGAMHSFSGSPELARQLTDRGWYISFSGPVTYKNAAKVKEAAASVPLNRILVETDTPYLPPTPHRGKLNYPGYVALTVRAIAELRNMEADDVAEITSENAKTFFRIDE